MNLLHSKKLLCIFIIFSCQQWANSSNILFWFTGGTYSHEITIWPLAVRLADQNHSITFYTPYRKKPWKDNRIKVVVPPEIEAMNTRNSATNKFTMRLTGQTIYKAAPIWSYAMCEYFLNLEESGDRSENNVLWNNGEKFDLVFVDAVRCDCGHAIAYFHNAKVIVSDSSPVLPWFHSIYGFPPESDWLPAMTTRFQYQMSLFNRIENFWETWYWTYIRRTLLYPKLDNLMERVFIGKGKIPSFLEMERKTDLIFVNTHASVELPRSLPPNVVKVGGIQLWAQKDSVVPKSVNEFIEKAEAGVILLAFGSAIDFASMPKWLEVAFFEAFRRFPQINFIAKANVSSTPENFPRNLKFEKWLPQKEILAHPKTLAFITHGGLNGIMEATYFGVPLIAMPIFAEQDFEAYHMQARETGIRLEMRELTADALSDAIGNVTTDSKYRKNMRKLQAAFRDRPEGNPLDLATKYTEFVLKHDDLSFMNPITYQPLTVYLEEIIFSPYFLTTTVVSLIAATVIATCCSLKLLCRKK